MPFSIEEAFANFLSNVQRLGLEILGRYYGSYRAVVYSNEDPLKMGRIQVIVPMLTGTRPHGEWADPKFPGAGDQTGIFHPPEKFDRVWVQFEGGDPDYPVYEGGWWAFPEEGENEVPLPFQKNPPTAKGWFTKAGHHLLFENEKDGEAVRLSWCRPGTKKDKSDALYSYMSINKDGTILLQNHQGTFVMLNAKDGEEGVTIMDKHGNIIASKESDVTLIHKDGALVELKKDQATIMAKQVVISGEGLNVKTGGATMGEGATEPFVLGNKLLALWSQAAVIFGLHMHPTTSPGAPTGPPAGPTWPTYSADTNSTKNKSA